MENPADWSLVDASLAVWDLESDARGAWAFLAGQGLVRVDAAAEAAFLALVKEEVGRGPITGPSVAKRVAGGLQRAGLLAPGIPPDPWGRTAQARRDALQKGRAP